MQRLFVYGTLRHGEPNWRNFIPDLQPIMQNVVTKPEFKMVTMGGFPGVMRGGTRQIVGDVFEVPEERVKPIDALEGHPQFYRREFIHLENGEQVEAYLLPEALYGKRPEIPSGDWLRHKAGR